MRWLIALLALLLLGSRSIASLAVEAAWRTELGQFDAWIQTLLYTALPWVAIAILLFAIYWIAHARGLKAAGSGFAQIPGYAWAATGAIAGLAVILALVLTDGWTLVRYLGSRGAAPGPADPYFGLPLAFYFFELPFWRMALRLAIAALLGGWLAYMAGSRKDWRLPGRWVAAGLFLLLAANFYLGRYDELFADHGLLVGIDWLAEHVTLPLQWVRVIACVVAAALAVAGQGILGLGLIVVASVAVTLVPPAVSALYVRPSEIVLQKPYVARHIDATRQAYGLKDKIREVEFPVKPEPALDAAKYRVHLENVRLWDRNAFHDAVAQLQALRPYYEFKDTDVDRYWIPDGKGGKQIRHMLITARELDVDKVPDATRRWNNPHFIYTHGYGVVMAEASRQTADGLPEFVIRNAPPEITRPEWFKLTRPELYYGEVVHEPVFVRASQPEFNYPSGSENVHNKYEGKGGIPLAGLIRLAAAMREGDWNIMFTQFMTSETRMLIRRNVRDRVEALAPFLDWDTDPYLVVQDNGRLQWLIDGFTTSRSAPFAKAIRAGNLGSFNYIRNPVKAAVDAYDGTVKLYVFDRTDPVLTTYARVFPKLFTPVAEMPADLRAHARYPEPLFRVQAEIYRTYHMRDAEAFYNKEDVWDIAENVYTQEGRTAAATPRYIVGTVPGSEKPEFLLTLPFTPRTKQNLVGLMMARSDGENLGQIVVLEMSKQELIYGPMQVKARINQDQTISKDLTLWNQQGSKVLRGQLVILPIDKSFLYIEPIYLQAAQNPMPQLKKTAIALGNRLSYADTYEEALNQLGARLPLTAGAEGPGADPAKPAALGAAQASESREPAGQEAALEEARRRFRRYRELMSQGQFGEAGKELEALEKLLR